MCTNQALMLKVKVDESNTNTSEWFLKNHKFKIKDGYAWRFAGSAKTLSEDYDLKLLGPSKRFDNAEYVSIPCGNCIECRLYYSREWASRCMLEAQSWSSNWFITLTYDDDHLPRGVLDNPTLDPNHFKNFLKAIRAKFKKELNHINVRFYGCGEYGDESLRPHYHLIMFNCPIPDLTTDIPFFDKDSGKSYIIQKQDDSGNPMYYSQFVKDCWKYGNIIIGRVEWNSAAYVARYVLKKQKGIGAEFYERFGMVPEFVRMSRKPGIGGDYFEFNKDKILNDDKIYVSKGHGSVALTPPRFFEKILQKDVAYNNILCDTKNKRELRRKRKLLLEYSTSELSKIERDNRQNFLNKVRSTVFKRNKGE